MSEDIESCCWKIRILLKNSDHFIHLLKLVYLQSVSNLVSCNVVCLFNNVPVEELLRFIRNTLHKDNAPAKRSLLQVEATVSLLEV